MSHLTILPTVLRDAEGLAASLVALGHTPIYGGVLNGFAAERQSVLLQVVLPGGERLGWQRHLDGSLALVGDLQRLLGAITRRYAAELALRQAASAFPGAQVSVAS